MSTYQQLLEKIEGLKAEAESVRQKEIQAIVADIRAKIDQYQLSANDIFGRSAGGKGKAKSSVAAKYRNPATGDTWTGRGRAPRWLADAEASGRKRESFLI